jgi:hypothetical protein
MAFILPTFNLTCDIYDNGGVFPPVAAPRLTPVCNLAFGRRVNVLSTGGTTVPGLLVIGVSLLLPPLTDVRGQQDAAVQPDYVQCPAGSGRWYQVQVVEDIGKGFANEHRSAALYIVAGSWTSPYP